MAVFKEITPNSVKNSRSYLNQLVDVLQQNISGSSSRKTYQLFATGGVGPGVTSSLFQTVFDSDFSLQTSNAIMDMTIGLFSSGTVVNGSKTGEDSTGKLLFPSSSMQMREKVDIYRQFAGVLLGNASEQFSAPFDSTGSSDLIENALFICFKRLFSRDAIKRETFAMKFYQTAALDRKSGNAGVTDSRNNLHTTSEYGASIYTDIGSANNKLTAFGGNVGNLVDASNTSRNVGVIFYDRGIAVLDLSKVISGSQHCSGTVDALNSNTGPGFTAGQTLIGHPTLSENPEATFIPDFLVSGSIDNIVNHIAACRFSSGSQTSITFQNVTNINSTLFFLELDADNFNYSSNPTFIDSDNRIIVIDEGQEETQDSFTFVTRVGLYDANDNLLAVAAPSRPIEKNPEKAFNIRVRLDY